MIRDIGMVRCALVLSCLLSVWQTGCGYSWVRGDGQCAFATIQVEKLEDHSVGHRLAAKAQQRLANRLAGRKRPRVLPSAPHRLYGRIMPVKTMPLGHDAKGRAWADHATVKMELWVVDGQGNEVWHSGSLQRSHPWIRGQTLLDSKVAKDLAERAALDEAVDDLVLRFLNTSSWE